MMEEDELFCLAIIEPNEATPSPFTIRRSWTHLEQDSHIPVPNENYY